MAGVTGVTGLRVSIRTKTNRFLLHRGGACRRCRVSQMPTPVPRPQKQPDFDSVTTLIRSLEEAMEEKQKAMDGLQESMRVLKEKHRAAVLIARTLRGDVPLDADLELTNPRKNTSPARLLALKMTGVFTVKNITDRLSEQGIALHRSSVKEALDRMIEDNELALAGESLTGSRHYRNLQVSKGNENPEVRPVNPTQPRED